MAGRLLSALGSVSAGTSAFFEAELAAFVFHTARARPASWAKVQALQLACIYEKPVTAAGAEEARRVLAAMW